jgi:8-oxo-dGTP pyrophosphatase MutT (NUDIX family)
VLRTEYYGDPNGPKPNALVPAASTVVANERGEILMQRREDNGLWALPAGLMELGESIGETAIRETREETGFEIEIVGVVGIYSDPLNVIEFSDGEVRQWFNICFCGRVTGGSLRLSDESTDVRWVAREELDRLPIHHMTRLRLRHFFDARAQPYVG